MKTEKQLQIRYTIFESLADLPAEAQTLMAEAVAARHNAYAPYSKFKVGAAVLVGNGKIFIGSNQENAAFPSGLIAISGTAEDPTGQPVSPCGACRQSLSEYETKQQQPIPVYFMGAKGSIIRIESIKDLLPFLFDGSLL